MVDTAVHSHDEDSARLAELGYKSDFKRDMSLWENFALGFTYLSPVVGIYTVFAFAIGAAGPAVFWSLAIVGVGQFLVALVFGETVAQFPVAGGVYPWARRLWGKRWGWMTGWVYMVAIMISVASIAYGSGPYLALVFGIEVTPLNVTLSALVTLTIATLINVGGTKLLSRVAFYGFIAEILGAVAVGTWLLIHNAGNLDFTRFFDTGGTAELQSSKNYLFAFMGGAMMALYQFFGFEACGDVAEEVPNPGRVIPQAMRRTIYIGGAAATFVCGSLILSIPNIGDVISGKDSDPVMTILTSAFGETGAKLVLGVVLLSFVSCAVSLQAAASRLTYSYGRDHMIFGSRLLSRFNEKRHIPPYALAAATIVPAAICVAGYFSADAVFKIVSFAVLGIYLGFQMVVLAAMRARLKGWVPSGKFALSPRVGKLVNAGALSYGVIAITTIVWPHAGMGDFAFSIDNYLILISGIAVLLIGYVYMVIAKPYLRGDAPAGDAVPKQ